MPLDDDITSAELEWLIANKGSVDSNLRLRDLAVPPEPIPVNAHPRRHDADGQGARTGYQGADPEADLPTVAGIIYRWRTADDPAGLETALWSAPSIMTRGLESRDGKRQRSQYRRQH